MAAYFFSFFLPPTLDNDFVFLLPEFTPLQFQLGGPLDFPFQDGCEESFLQLRLLHEQVPFSPRSDMLFRPHHFLPAARRHF